MTTRSTRRLARALRTLRALPGAAATAVLAAALPGALPAALHAQQSAPADSARRDSTGARARALAPVRVTGRYDDLVGTAATASQGYVGAAELRARPMTREGEILETVPGLIVTQHSGEGKANQYFVRGFNLDHGTDFQTRVDGVPVNMPTHGHGQGYTDLNFLVPELVDHLEYRLGNYHAALGDFGSAGGADISLARALDRPFAVAQTGAFGLARAAAGASPALGAGTLLVGGELKAYDGPWQRAEGIRKASGLARYAWGRGASRFSVLAMAYRNRWNANDQVPDRAVDEGLISSFGQIDSTDGGAAQRYSLSGEWRRTRGRSVQTAQLYGVRSTLDLFSNFTYFLDDPVSGDQFEQVDRRTVLGGNVANATQLRALGTEHVVTVGLQTRADLIGAVGLYRTAAQQRLATVRADRVTESGTGLYAEAESRWRPWFRTVLGLREDAYTFRVRSDGSAPYAAENSGDRTAAIASPKASLVFTPSPRAEVYVSGGYGFHSNDARGTTIRVDPASGDSARRVDPLVRSRGAEVGLRATTLGGLRSTVSLWALDLDSELLFTGDAGTTEPSAASRRRGVTFANYYRPLPALALDADVSFARARFVDTETGTTYVPGALENVVAGGATWNPGGTPGGSGLFATLRVRHFGAYPLVEDNAVRARAATLLNAEVGYRLPAGLRLRASLLNLANARADDIQYYYTSRLRGETAGGVDDVHAHPVEPRQLRVSLSWGL